jgi:hypothetical protein
MRYCTQYERVVKPSDLEPVCCTRTSMGLIFLVTLNYKMLSRTLSGVKDRRDMPSRIQLQLVAKTNENNKYYAELCCRIYNMWR